MKIAIVTGAINRRNGANGSMLDLYAALLRLNHSVDLFVTDRPFFVGVIESLVGFAKAIRPLWLLRRKKYDAIFLIASSPAALFIEVNRGGARTYTFQTSDPIPTEAYIAKVSNCNVLLFQSPAQLDAYESMKSGRAELLARAELLRPTTNEGKLARQSYKAIPNDQFLVLIGSIQPRKNQLYMTRVFEALCRLGYCGNLYLVGRVLDQEYSQEIVEFCNRSGLKDRVIMTGHLNQYEHFLRHAECVCSTSVEEGLSTIIREGFFFGQLMLAIEIDGNSGALSNANSVLVQRDVEPEKVASQLWRVLSDPSAVRSLKDASRTTYSLFSNAAYDRELSRLIEKSP